MISHASGDPVEIVGRMNGVKTNSGKVVREFTFALKTIFRRQDRRCDNCSHCERVSTGLAVVQVNPSPIWQDHPIERC